MTTEHATANDDGQEPTWRLDYETTTTHTCCQRSGTIPSYILFIMASSSRLITTSPLITRWIDDSDVFMRVSRRLNLKMCQATIRPTQKKSSRQTGSTATNTTNHDTNTTESAPNELLHQHGVHGVVIVDRELPLRRRDVEVGRQLALDLARQFRHLGLARQTRACTQQDQQHSFGSDSMRIRQ